MEQALFDLDKIPKKSPEEKQLLRKEITRRLESIKKFKILLPKIELTYHDTRRTIGLSYLPLSMSVVSSFLYQAYINEGNVLNFTIKYFLDKLDLLHAKIFDDLAVQKILESEHNFKKVNYTGPKLRLSSKSRVQINNLAGPGIATSPREDEEYYVIYQENSQASSSPSLLGDRKDDASKGIYHFVPGMDRGLVKNINFTKFEVPYKRESLMVDQTNLYDELMMPYSANVQMFGNNLFLPGSQIYIDPWSIGFGDPQDKNSAAVKLGLGGYYTVLSVTTRFSPGSLETTLDCSFGSFPTSVTGKGTKITYDDSILRRKNKEGSIDRNADADAASSPDAIANAAPAPRADREEV